MMILILTFFNNCVSTENLQRIAVRGLHETNAIFVTKIVDIANEAQLINDALESNLNVVRLTDSDKIFVVPSKGIKMRDFLNINLDDYNDYIYTFNRLTIDKSNKEFHVILNDKNKEEVVFKRRYKIWAGIRYDSKKHIAYKTGKYYIDWSFLYSGDLYNYRYKPIGGFGENVFLSYNDILNFIEWVKKVGTRIISENLSNYNLIIGKNYLIRNYIRVENKIGEMSYSAKIVYFQGSSQRDFQFVLIGANIGNSVIEYTLPDNKDLPCSYPELIYNGVTSVITQGGFVRILPEFIYNGQFIEPPILPLPKIVRPLESDFLRFSDTDGFIEIEY
jgi:hypothetical protein